MGKAAFSADDQLEFDFVSEYKIVRTKVSRWNYLLCLTCGFFYLFVYSGHPEQVVYYSLRPDLRLCPYCRCVISAVDEQYCPSILLFQSYQSWYLHFRNGVGTLMP